MFELEAAVDLKVLMYLAYLGISVGLTIWVARTLSRNGLVFLQDVFSDDRLAKAVNNLLVVGFYLLNLGYVTVAMRHGGEIRATSQALEELSLKIGLVLLVLGVLHFFNVFALNRYRRSRLRQQAPRPPLPPAGHMAPPPQGPPPHGPHQGGHAQHQGPPAAPAHQGGPAQHQGGQAQHQGGQAQHQGAPAQRQGGPAAPAHQGPPPAPPVPPAGPPARPATA